MTRIGESGAAIHCSNRATELSIPSLRRPIAAKSGDWESPRARFIGLFAFSLPAYTNQPGLSRPNRGQPIMTTMGSTSIVRLDRQNPYLRIDAVNVFVKDQDRSLDFYLNRLGFDLALDISLQSGHRLVAV